MVVTRLLGGLGNQMFQYAFGRAVAIKNNTHLLLDIKELANKDAKHIYRNYSLNQLSIKAELLVGEIEIESKRKKDIPKNIFHKLIGKQKFKSIVEQKFHFDEKMPFPEDNSYLQGYWQSPKYFEAIENEIRNEFQYTAPLSKAANNFLTDINNAKAVSLHIRRGDYANNPETLAYHGMCDLDYYVRAINFVSSKIENPVYFIFSDDSKWVEENFNSAALGFDFKCVLVCKENLNQFEDLKLMSSCKHAIIANSSFSWWGAWLINQNEKIVVAPQKWLANTDINTDNLFPAQWIRM